LVECVDGELWVDIDPLAELQSGDGTILLDNMPSDTLEISDGMGGWTEIADPATTPLIVGQYRAIYRYSFDDPVDDPDMGVITLESIYRIIDVVDTDAPVVTVYGDTPITETYPGFGALPTYTVSAGAYATWAQLAAALGSPPDGVYAEAVDGCDGTINSLASPANFTIDVYYYDADVGLGAPISLGLNDAAAFLAAPVLDPADRWAVIYQGTDGEGNAAAEAGARAVNVTP
jgi:hypothetical protein